ncbi:hypothetical protein J6590_046901 [Homalodisca vitripennis]|nr:hypothetical protein J6590_046901 [Homalodisca vitripennis]
MRKEASPFRFTMESSAFQPAQERKDSLITQKVQRLVTDRVQTSTENIDKTKSRGPMQPTSPLRVISGQGLSYGTESPAEPPIDQEDREVEITMTSDTNSHVYPTLTLALTRRLRQSGPLQSTPLHKPLPYSNASPTSGNTP